ncbi:MAG: YfhO family protein [Chloroflexota bacterium]|nr:YfhO family protein [Chloroflexota bacterium]
MSPVAPPADSAAPPILPLPAAPVPPAPLTRRELGWAMLLCALMVSLFLGPALVGGRILSPSDLLYDYPPWHSQAPLGWSGASNPVLSDDVLAFEPWLAWAAQQLHAGEWPLWQPDNMLGAPFIGNMQSAVFDPLNWPYLLWPDPIMLVARVWLKLFLLALGMYVLARDTLRVRPPAAGLAVVTFTFSAFMTSWLLYPLTAVVVWLPWLWWATARLMARPGPRPLAGLAAVVALSLLAGHPETSYQVAVYTGGFALWSAWQAAPRRPVAFTQRMALWAAAYGLGAALTAIQLLPFVEYLTHSAALGGRVQATAADGGYPFRYFWTAFSPDLFGNHAHQDWWDIVANYNEVNTYAGLLPWLLLPFALLVRDRRQRRLAAGLIGAALLALGTIYGWPIIRPLVLLVPLMSLNATGRLVLFVQFALALLAALGAEAILTGLSERRRGRLGLLAGVGGLVAGLGIGYPWLNAQAVFLLPADQPAALATWNAALLRTTVLLVLAAGGLAAVIAWGRTRPRLAQFGLAGLVLLAGADLWQAHGDYNPTVAPTAYYPPTALTDFLRAQPGLFRYAATDWALMPNTNLLYGLANFGGYDALDAASYHEAAVRIDPLLAGGGFTPFHSLQSRLINLFNVRYLLTPPDSDPNYYRDQSQEVSEKFGGEIQGRHQVGQTFVAGRDNLAEIRVLGGTFGRRLRGPLVFHLKTDPSASSDLVTQAVDSARLQNGHWWIFPFAPIAASKGRTFYFYLDAPGVRAGQAGTISYNSGDLYTPGTRYVDGQPAAGDLVFRAAALLDPGKPWFQRVFTGNSGEWSIYENRQVLPRAWLTHRVIAEAAGVLRLQQLRIPDFDRAGTAVLNAPLSPDQPLPATPPAAGDRVTITRYAPEAVDIAADSPAAGVLILADQAFPGWQATVDGQPAPILTADHALRGVYLSAGTHTVQFRYRPASFAWGAAITALAGLGLLGLTAWPWRVARRRRL